ncbi:MAG TPA: GAF domain-containing protein [Polyangiaceae bacterium]|nr:GAF domain-containing protein [Polyangiaceae bacterium]
MSEDPGRDLRTERDEFLQKFGRGASLARQFLHDYEALEQRLRALESENAELRAKVEADHAVRDLLRKIETLEAEKAELLSRFNRAEEISSSVTARMQDVELEFANLANLFVASTQLNSSLSPRAVTRRIKEILAQLVGAERYAMYLLNPEGTELVPIASEGVPGGELLPVRVGGTRLGAVVESGSAAIDEEADPSQGTLERPAAIIPLMLDERTVGVVAIFATLAQKGRFHTVDFELFRLLGRHAAAALVGASLFAQAEHKLPGLEAFLDLSV